MMNITIIRLGVNNDFVIREVINKQFSRVTVSLVKIIVESPHL